jgi:ATP-binding cassette subfamily C protein
MTAVDDQPAATPKVRELLPVASARATWSALGHEIAQLRGRTTLALLASVGATLAGLVGPWALGRLVDDVIDRAGAPAIVRVTVLLVGSAIAAAVLTMLGFWAITHVGASILARLRERVVDRALRLPSARLEKVGSGDLLTRVGDDVAVVTAALITLGPLLVSSLLTVVLTLAGIASLDWRLALAGAAALPIYVVGTWWYLPRSAPMYARERALMSARSEALISSLQGSTTVQAYRLEERHTGVINARSSEAMDMSVSVFRLLARFLGYQNRAESIGLSAILAVGFFLVRDGATTVGATTAAALYFHRLFGPLGALMMTFDEVQSAGASLARLVGVATIELPAEPAVPAVPRDAGVRITGLTHHYEGGPVVLDEVSMHIEPGERVALVGASGAGKTTLASIVAGLLVPSSGLDAVRIGGASFDQLGETRWRRQVALISQDVHVFSGPLLDDIRLAAPDATPEQVHVALEKVGATGWVAALPDGLDTVVGEIGHQLTASQAQQIALARLILADPPIAILDEATAEAGSAGAHELEQAAAAAMAGRTSLVVAHRLTQAAAADRVIVMEHGRIVEDGPHAQLVGAGGRYATLWQAWQGRASA